MFKAPEAPDAHSLELAVQESPYDFHAIFGNDAPVELEIGIGKGRFLMDAAKARPDTNFIGIEWANKFYRLAQARAHHKGLGNIRFLRDDAMHTFRAALPRASLAALHIYFPDPWPKKRHHKRRLVQAAFLDLAALALAPRAMVYLATDHAGYFAQMVEVASAHPRFAITEQLSGETAHVGVTNYEVKYREQGRPIHNLRLATLP